MALLVPEDIHNEQCGREMSMSYPAASKASSQERALSRPSRALHRLFLFSLCVVAVAGWIYVLAKATVLITKNVL
jgi:hypothetical protein